MSILPYILPALTVVSLFLYIFSAERSWLPQKGTTEWIVRASTPKTMTADIKFDLKWKDIIIVLAIIVVYGGLLSFYSLPITKYDIIDIVKASVFSGIIYIFAQILFENRITAFFAAAMTAVSLLLLTDTLFFFESSAAIVLFVFFILIASNKPWAFIPAGIFLNTAVYHDSIYILFVLPALCPAIVSTVRTKRGMPMLLYLIFCVSFSAASFGFSQIWHLSWCNFNIANVFTQPLYFTVSVVCLIITVIHIFKDKCYTALLISAGLIVSLVCELFGVHISPVFTGLAIAYPASIIVQRGKKAHRVFCIIFGSVMILAFIAAVAYRTLDLYAPHIAKQLADIFTFVFPFLSY